MPGRRRIRRSTSALSAICGTQRGETKAPASIARRPASASISMSRTLSAAATVVASFWSPSRGPTSTMLTSAGSGIGGLLAGGREGDQQRTLLHQVARLVVDALDHAVG